jgi:two-component system cell cycle sensor histidine kinase/response regulator CckA
MPHSPTGECARQTAPLGCNVSAPSCVLISLLDSRLPPSHHSQPPAGAAPPPPPRADRDLLLAQLQAALESTTDAILVVDLEGRIQMFNRLFAEISGLPDDVLNRRDDALAVRHVLEKIANPESFLAGIEAMTTQPHVEGSDTVRFKDGRVFERFSRPQWMDGVPVGRVWSFRDVTQRVRDEEHRALLESYLREARKMESLGTLAGGVAHDFNNLLSGICGYAEIARERVAADHPAAPCLAQILHLGQRARDVVRQILTFSRRTAGEYKPIDLGHTVAGALGLSRFSLPDGAELQTQFEPHCPPVAADATQIHQALLNLCTNAAHALPPTGGRVQVSVARASLPARLAATEPVLARRPVVRLSVADNGCGIDPAILDRIFEPFFTTKEPGKGTGLGLAVVHGIVGAHGGAVDVRSQRGLGTTFDLYFPALPEAIAAPPETSDSAPPLGRHESILWVDDNPAAGTVVEELLRLLHYEVTYCQSGEEALAHFRSRPQAFAMLITDLAMPGLGGEELARAVLSLRPDLPVLVMTGLMEPRQQAALQQAGVREILFKPVPRTDLARAVARHLIPPPARV